MWKTHMDQSDHVCGDEERLRFRVPGMAFIG